MPPILCLHANDSHGPFFLKMSICNLPIPREAHSSPVIEGPLPSDREIRSQHILQQINQATGLQTKRIDLNEVMFPPQSLQANLKELLGIVLGQTRK
ncbi:hypothetical protein DQK91_18245 [Oceanidesulfovibrio marinus]|uniref:Uncharacterized protein n=1 Tax=Oceanidesulfovibrio marinus TaxID=370038 RepID=A0A6P1ZD42_9BACT|nr:hypothetical protein DQK91_18245 [Oceanidesulfovibrio marinus]